MHTKYKEVKEPSINVAHVAPRYVRVDDVQRIFGIKRTTLFALLKAGRVKSCSISVTGGRARTRLIDFASVEAFIQSQMAMQKGKVSNV